MKKINLHLKENSYSILMGRGLISRLGALLKPLKLGSRILIVSNKDLAERFLKPEFKRMKDSLRQAGYQLAPPYLLPYGDERDKSEKTLFGLWSYMAKIGLERTSALLAFGGGVVGDVAGFAASTYMRGIALIQVPTTLLAQVDAAIGGKTAIDLPLAKNIVGTFYQPRMVIVDVETLKRLSEFRVQELRNAFAEVIKYGVIQEVKLFQLLEQKLEWFFSSLKGRSLGRRELFFLERVIWLSAQLKAKVVEEDERETKGKRMILNYGHTFAHAFEAASQFRLPHGEAVALGMVCAARLARGRGLFRGEDELRQNRLIQRAGLPFQIDRRRFDRERVLRHMLLDKKKKEGRLRLVLPEAMGRVRVVEDVSRAEVRKVLLDLGGK